MLKRVNLPTRVYDLLKQRILKNELLLGQKLFEEQLAQQLGVSRTPVREALNRLVQEGLVVSRPGRGAFICSFSLKDVLNLLDVREALEGMAARLAAARMEQRTLTSFRSKLEVEINEKDGAYTEADREFHEEIIAACGNPYLSQLMLSLREKIQLLRYRSVAVPGRARKSFQEHIQIIEALSDRNPDLAEMRIRSHIRNVKEDLEAAAMENLDEGKSASD